MRRTQLPITTLQAYSKLNDISFFGIAVQDLGPKGFGLIAEQSISSETADDTPCLLTIPHGLILCAQTIEEYAKADQHFHQLLEAAGGRVISSRI
jgi:hypothetical protein